jgi:hypothetical protein
MKVDLNIPESYWFLLIIVQEEFCLLGYNTVLSIESQPTVRRNMSLLATFFTLVSHSFMELIPSLESANCTATQELPCILWNPKVRYRVHQSPPLVPILSHISPINTIPSYLRSILILSTATCSRWFLARGFFHPEDGGDTFLENVGSHKIYTPPHPRRRNSSF